MPSGKEVALGGDKAALRNRKQTNGDEERKTVQYGCEHVSTGVKE